MFLSALLMGLAGTVHCAAMCGVPSAAVMRACAGPRSRQVVTGFFVARALGYAAVGAVAAASVAGLAWLGQWSPALRPLWAMAHLAALALGVWLLIHGRQPIWLERLGGPHRLSESQTGWQPVRFAPLKASLIGAVWFAWPCGLLQSALMVAALANSPTDGALVMLVFALASAPGLGVGPVVWQRWLSGRGDRGEGLMRWVVRLSGLALVLGSAWALGHDLWSRVAAYCLS